MDDWIFLDILENYITEIITTIAAFVINKEKININMVTVNANFNTKLEANIIFN